MHLFPIGNPFLVDDRYIKETKEKVNSPHTISTDTLPESRTTVRSSGDLERMGINSKQMQHAGNCIIVAPIEFVVESPG
ncbi:hypothetical protein VTN00DRAFT_979 [Thermoascus crustaceus]|uniref:uncharacterized protein n=1 Tax=Thermoascus crustaceus TaxID=5088 RepID=UPI0037448EAF